MLAESKFYGGAKYTNIAAAVQLSDNSERVQRFHNVSAGTQDVTLPINLPTYHKTVKGGFWYLIYLDSTSTKSLNIKYVKGSTFTLVTLSPGDAAFVWMTSSAEDWAYEVRTMGTSRTLTHSASAGIVKDARDPQYDPFCFEGDDCALAQADPLNGQAGNDTVLAAMFQDIPAYAKNQTREAIRAADVVMPNRVVVRLDQGCFAIDPLFPNTKELSEEFYNKLFNNGNPHILDYVPVASGGDIGGTTRNPYHMGWFYNYPNSGFTWDTNQSVVRRMWRKTINYTVEDTGVAYSIEIRFTMEQAMASMPVFDRCGGGPTNDHDSGAWGALFHLSVFATEIMPAWVEGNAFQTYGSADINLHFTKNDPIVNGGWHGVDTIDKKFFHPQMAMFAMLPTTWHSPCGRNWVPPHDRAHYHRLNDNPLAEGTGKAHNREKAYNFDNGAPWTTSFPYQGSPGTAFNNIVFGHTIGTTHGRGMSLGGDLPRSKPMEWLCWENGLGAGKTFFKPNKPGWNEAQGVLDVLNGNCGRITLPIDCFGNQDSEGPSADNKWHLDPHPCLGHPDEPFMAYGGSHKCFRNYDGGVANGGSGDETQCCITLSYQTAESAQRCTRTFNTYDKNCNQVEEHCTDTAWFWAQRVMYLDDYTYVAEGNQSVRQASWRRILQDPDQFDFTHAVEASDTYMVAERGTWDITTNTAKVTAVAGTYAVRAALLYERTSGPNTWTNNRDCIVTVHLKKTKQKSHVVLVKAQKDGATGIIYGYGLNIVPVSPGAGTTDLTCQLVKYKVDGTKVVLATATITGATSDDCDVSLEGWGTDLIASITPSGLGTTLMSAWDKDFVAGWPGVGTEATSTTGSDVWFTTLSIEDTSVDFLDITGYIGPNIVGITWPEELTFGYNKCNLESEPCGTDPYCNCIYWYDSKAQILSASGPNTGHDIKLRSVGPSGCVDGDNPTYCGGNSPKCCEYDICGDARFYSCSTCPPWFPAISFCFPQQCSVPKDYLDPDCDGYQETKPRMCAGITYWYGVSVVCD